MNPGLAVQAFFIISGFYMALVLDGKYTSRTTFYTNRLARLFPSYLVVLTLSAAALFVFGVGRFTQGAKFDDPSLWPLLIPNFTLIGQDLISWFNVTPDNHLMVALNFKAARPDVPAWHYLLVPQAWSLSFELMFYAIAPFITKRRISIIIGLAAASLAFRLLGNATDISYNLWPRRLFPAELCLFLLGVIAYRLRGLVPDLPAWVGWLTLGALVGFISIHSRLHIDTHITWAAMYFAVAVALPILFTTFANAKWDQTVAELSYPLYIVHVLAIGIVAKVGGPLWAIVLLSFALALILVLAIERPIDKIRQRRVRQPSHIEAPAFGYLNSARSNVSNFAP